MASEVGDASTAPAGDTSAVGEPIPISVVVVDDHLLLAETVAATLDDHHRITVVATAGTCADGAAAVRAHQPDVCLLDQRLPDGLGTDLVPHLLVSSPSTKVLLVTGDNAIEVVRDALRAGAIGVVGKGQRAAALREAVVRAADGITVLSAEDARRLQPTAGSGGPRIGEDLTPREREILELLADALSTSAIAARLAISHATARNHIQAVITKLHAHTRLEAVTIALRENVVSRS